MSSSLEGGILVAVTDAQIQTLLFALPARRRGDVRLVYHAWVEAFGGDASSVEAWLDRNGGSVRTVPRPRTYVGTQPPQPPLPAKAYLFPVSALRAR